MLLSKSRSFADHSRKATIAVSVLLAIGVSGCQVRPLYSDASPSASGVSTPAALKSVAVTEAKTRYGQEVRNQMIFLLGGGAGEASSPAYNLELGVTEQVISSASVQVDTSQTGQPTAGGVVLTSLYVLKDNATGAVKSSGKRTVTASFDRPTQQFASLRAQRDAENRAARELAELVYLAVAADLSK
ncbi:MAG: LPS assembly lipoprotein LptE [Rhizobiaceae bacterium]